MRAIFYSPFPDFDYREWLQCCGLRQVSRSSDVIVIEGARDDIEQFGAESTFELHEVQAPPRK